MMQLENQAHLTRRTSSVKKKVMISFALIHANNHTPKHLISNVRIRLHGVELDMYMYVHVPGRIDRRRISQPASSWPRGRETLKSAFRWTEEAQADEDLLSMLRASAADRSRSWSEEREGPSEKWPLFFSNTQSSVPKVFAKLDGKLSQMPTNISGPHHSVLMPDSPRIGLAGLD